MAGNWQTHSSKTVYQNNWFKIREDDVTRPDGNPGMYAVIDTNGPGVFILALNDDQKFTLVKLFRYPTQLASWELPGGNAGTDSPLEGAKKELREETGLTANTWRQVGTFQAWNGVTSELEHSFIATDLTKSNTNEQEEEGITETKLVSFDDAFAMIKNGEITDDQTITTITQAALTLGVI